MGTGVRIDSGVHCRVWKIVLEYSVVSTSAWPQ